MFFKIRKMISKNEELKASLLLIEYVLNVSLHSGNIVRLTNNLFLLKLDPFIDFQYLRILLARRAGL